MALWFVIAILIFSTTLRGPFTAVGPLLDLLKLRFDFSAGQAGLLITLPLAVFCVVSPFAPLLARRHSLERVLFVALVIMATGIVIRSTGPAWALFAGTAVLGVGIAIGNTLLPSLLKRDHPQRITTLTSIYAVVMGVASAASSAIVVPLAESQGWQVALGVFLLLPLLSALAWWPRLRVTLAAVADRPAAPRGGPVWRSALAWQVTLFLGTTSLVYYVVTAWLPSMLVEVGYTSSQAGAMHGLMQFATALPGLILATLVRRTRDQRAIAGSMALMALVGLLGLRWWPGLAWCWVAVFGFGIGGAFILGLAFIGLRAATAGQAAALSGMAQGLGYLMAATGPILFGMLHDLTGDWHLPLQLCAGLSLVIAGFGLGAGRSLQLGQVKGH